MGITSSHLVEYSTALGALAVIYYVLPYFLDPYEYRRFPGPPLARLTNWWMYRAVRAGHHCEVVHQLHAKHGTFVRLGPNHVSIADPDALEAVYGHNSGVLKSDFYHGFRRGPSTNVFNTLDKAEHSKKRRRLANMFSPQNVLAFQPRVRSHIRELCAQWDLRCKDAARGISGSNWTSKDGQAAMNVSDQFSYLAFDIIGDLALGSPFGLIQAQTDSSLSIESVDESGEPVRGELRIPVIATTSRAVATATAIGVFPAWTHKLLRLPPWNMSGITDNINLFKLTAASVEARVKRGHKKGTEDGEQSIDLLDKLLEAKDDDGNPLSYSELYAEVLIMLIAGSDTSSNTLSSLCYHLAIHPEIQHELQAELDVHIPYSSSDEVDDNEGLAALPNDTIACYDAIKDLPYLNACVKEALRIHSTISTGLPRSVPLGRTITVAGQTFKAGSVISVPSYTTNRSSVWGSDANEFRPGRWLESDAGSLNKYFVPFSVGPRACIGRNLAYMDLMLTAATLFRRYEVTALPTTKMTIHDAFVRGVVNCEVGIRRRTAL